MKTKRTVRQALLALAAFVCIGFGIAACDNGSTDVGNNANNNGEKPGKTPEEKPGETPEDKPDNHKQLAGDISISANTVYLDGEVTATYTGTEQGVSMRWNKDGEPVTGTEKSGTEIKLTANSAGGEGIYTVTVSADGFESKIGGMLIALDRSAMYEKIEGNFYYQKLGDFSVVTDSFGTFPQELTMPGTLGSLPVAGIWAELFWSASITSVNIPDSVIIIGEWAFAENDKLTSVTIPDSVIVI